MTNDELEIQDRNLLKRAIYKRDQCAQKYIYLKYKSSVQKFIKNKVSLEGYIDDLLQEVFVNICEGKCHYSGNTDVRGYLCGIAKNVVKYHIRREKRLSRINLTYLNNVSITSDRSTNTNKSEKYRFDKFQEMLHQTITRLPPKSRKAVELVLIHKVKQHQAAKRLGCSPVVLRNRLHRGLKELRKNIKASRIFRL